MISAIAIPPVAVEEASFLLTVGALHRRSFMFHSLQLTRDNLLLFVNEPDIDEPVDAANVGPYHLATVLDWLQGSLDTRAEFTAHFVDLRRRVLE